MKKLRNTIACGVAALALLATGLTSCTGDFDNINTSKDKPTPEDVDRDNAWAAFIQTMQRNVFAEGANAYQLADNLLGDSYAGYFGQAQDWDSGSNSTCYAFPTAKWKDEPYKQAYNNVMSSWNILRQKVDSASVVFALGEVVKVQAMHRVTDIYGPLPYTAFGKMSSGLPYDSQETVYRTFIKELDHALKTLKAAYEADSGAKPIADFDVVFDSDLEKWIRFANSLKLRLAMRARFAAPGDAQTWAEEAVNFQFGAYNIGVMTDNTHSAQLLTRTGIGFSYKHPLEYLWGEYNECCMGATMESYLSGYGDPRLESYFSPAEKDGAYHGIPNGIISNPNCTTIVTLVAINALAKESPIETIIASSYQAVSGAGKGGIDELNNEVKALSEGKHLEPKVFQYQIAYNIIPQIGGEAFEGYTSEEMKMQNEGRKILHLPEMKVSCTCARVPVIRSHSVSVVLRTKEKISVERAKEIIANAPGCKLVDDLKNKVYPMPLDTSDQDIVYVGRIREDLTDERGLNLWCCGDQVRKGAATNTIQIAELLLK